MTGLALAVLLAASNGPTLEEARAAERAALTAERDALTERLAELKAARKAQQRKGVQSARELSAALESLRTRGDRLSRDLEEARREEQADAPADANLIRRQAAELFASEAFEYEGPEPDQETTAPEVLTAAAAALERAGRIRITPGRFHGPDGREVEGDVAHIGAVAAYGRAGELVGPLITVDQRHAMLETRDVGQVFGGAGAAVVPLFIGEIPPRRGADETTIAERVAAAGLLAWPILALGFLVLLFGLERIVLLWIASSGDVKLEEKIAEALASGLSEQVEALVAGGRSGVARLTRAILSHRTRDREAQLELAQSALVGELARVENRLGFFKLAAGVAPLLGLLGTVVGMIETFDVISVHGSGDASRLSGGISKALVTTELGLIVAVPTLFIHSLLASRIDRIADRLERVARDFPLLLDSAPANTAQASATSAPVPTLSAVGDAPEDGETPKAHREAYG